MRKTQGKIPKNDFGNIDLYTPSMLPAGATHIPRTSSPFSSRARLRYEGHLLLFCFVLFTDKGTANIARQLGFDHAEAVVRTTTIISSEMGSGDLTHAGRRGNCGAA